MVITLILSTLVVTLGIDRILLSGRFNDFKKEAGDRLKDLEHQVDTFGTNLRLAIGPKLRELHDRVDSLEASSIASASPQAEDPTSDSKTQNTAAATAGSTVS